MNALFGDDNRIENEQIRQDDRIRQVEICQGKIDTKIEIIEKSISNVMVLIGEIRTTQLQIVSQIEAGKVTKPEEGHESSGVMSILGKGPKWLISAMIALGIGLGTGLAGYVGQAVQGAPAAIQAPAGPTGP